MSGAATQAERSLAAAVIEQQWRDALAEPVRGGGAPTVTRPRLRDHREARLFLTAPSGPWAESREYWSQAAQIDAEALRSRALRALPEAPPEAPRAVHRTRDRQIGQRLLALLRAAARDGRRAPTNSELARALGRTKGTVASLLGNLRLAGAIRIEAPGRGRIIVAADGSWRTATPEDDDGVE